MKTFAVAKRLIKQIGGDKRTIGLLFLAPVFALFLLSIILTAGTAKPNIDLVGGGVPTHFAETLKKDAKITLRQNEAEAIIALQEGKSDAFIIFKNNLLVMTIEGADPTLSKLVLATISKELTENMYFNLMLSSQFPAGSQLSLQPEIKYLYGSQTLSNFDAMAPLLMGFFIFFFVFLIAGVSFLRERISGTLDRILATPLKRSEIVMGYFFGFGVFVTLQTLIIQLFMVYGLQVPNAGSFWSVLVINLLLAAGSLSLGTLLSAFAKNEFQLFQFIPLVIVPQILFSGIFDLREAPIWVKSLSKIFPMTYGAEALRDIMIRGYNLVDVWIPALIMLGYALLFIVLNILVLKKYRRI
ncbi:MAG: ABC transporter permease [Clostridia bacterium]